MFRTKSFEERTVHEELAKNMTGLLKLNDQVTVKQVLKVNDADLAICSFTTGFQPKACL